MGTKQQETATVVATITLAGNAKVIVTGAYIPNSPVTVSVPVLLGDNAAAVALACRTYISLDGDITTAYDMGGATDKIILTDHYYRANDTTLNISIADDSCTGITTAPTSANTTAGDGLTNAYATLAEFKAYKTTRGPITSATDASDDVVMEDLLEQSSRYIDSQTGRRFWKNSADETRYYTPTNDGYVFTDDLADAPTQVITDTGFDRTYATTMGSTDYDLMPDNAAVYGRPYTWLEIVPASSEFFPVTRKGVEIVGTFGWPAVPDDIKEACLSITLNLYQARSGQTSAGNVTVTAGGVIIRPQDVPPLAQKTIDSYRRLS
jgi:hypothetical protein